MTTMNISIPDPMKDWVQAQIDTGKYAGNSDYIRDLLNIPFPQMDVHLHKTE